MYIFTLWFNVSFDKSHCVASPTLVFQTLIYKEIKE